MDLFSFLATLILVTTIVTLVISLMAYIAYKIREARKPLGKPVASGQAGGTAPIFLLPASTEVLEQWKDPGGRTPSAHAAAASFSTGPKAPNPVHNPVSAKSMGATHASLDGPGGRRDGVSPWASGGPTAHGHNQPR